MQQEGEGMFTIFMLLIKTYFLPLCSSALKATFFCVYQIKYMLTNTSILYQTVFVIASRSKALANKPIEEHIKLICSKPKNSPRLQRRDRYSKTSQSNNIYCPKKDEQRIKPSAK
jgi:hypothetical protein